MNLIQKVIKIIGIDGAVAFTILSRVIQVIGGLIIVVLIPLLLSKEQQGYYYTFGSILALQVFFELGLNNIITQYVAHEAVHLTWLNRTTLKGNKNYESRLSSILHLCLKVFSISAVVLFIILTFAGFVFFSKYGESGINWMYPWLLVSFGTALLLFINPILAFLEGLGEAKDVAKIRVLQYLVNITCIMAVLYFKGGLYALGFSSILSFFVIFGCIFFSYRMNLLKGIYLAIGSYKISYVKEIFPYQYKIAISWISGYLIFQLFNPILFATEGAVIAGKMGMTLAILNGVISIPSSWIRTKISIFSAYIAGRQYDKLDMLFQKTILQALIIHIFVLIIILSAFLMFKSLHFEIIERFLGFFSFMILAIASVFQFILDALAVYLRCHKKEPFLILSIVIGATVGVMLFVFGKSLGILGICIGYCLIFLFGTFWGYRIFKDRKRVWHTF